MENQKGHQLKFIFLLFIIAEFSLVLFSQQNHEKKTVLICALIALHALVGHFNAKGYVDLVADNTYYLGFGTTFIEMAYFLYSQSAGEFEIKILGLLLLPTVFSLLIRVLMNSSTEENYGDLLRNEAIETKNCLINVRRDVGETTETLKSMSSHLDQAAKMLNSDFEKTSKELHASTLLLQREFALSVKYQMNEVIESMTALNKSTRAIADDYAQGMSNIRNGLICTTEALEGVRSVAEEIASSSESSKGAFSNIFMSIEKANSSFLRFSDHADNMNNFNIKFLNSMSGLNENLRTSRENTTNFNSGLNLSIQSIAKMNGTTSQLESSLKRLSNESNVLATKLSQANLKLVS
jgi:hypothetical protein